MPARRYISRPITFAGFVLIAIAAADYVSRSTAQSPPFAPHSNLVAPADLADDAWSGGPRECDALKGISADCVFMD